MTQGLARLEMAVLEALQSLHGGALLDGFMLFVSRLGNGGFLFIALALGLLCIRRTRSLGGACATALALDVLTVNVLLKPLAARARPFDGGAFELLLPPPGDYSFPSGHTAAAFAFAFALAPAGKKWMLRLCRAALSNRRWRAARSAGPGCGSTATRKTRCIGFGRNGY